MGGYLLGQTRGQQEELDAERLLANEAAGLSAAREAERKEKLQAKMAADTVNATLRGQDMTSATAAANRTASAEAAATETEERREEGTKFAPYSLDGKVYTVATDATGNHFFGTTDGQPLTNEQASRMVPYKPGTEGGTLADQGSFQMPIEEETATDRSMFGNLFTSPYFDQSTGVFDPERWAGTVGLGPDGSMVQATQSTMATATLTPMAQRMEEINLRPWTEKEIQTITADFPDADSQYPDWARFGATVMIPKMEAKFSEAIAAGRSTPQMREQVIGQMYDDVVEGWSMNAGDRSLKDLERLGVPKERIKDYLRRKQEAM
jgi:hypothetical protein